jgi:mono/diheme cytochrome c family protein
MRIVPYIAIVAAVGSFSAFGASSMKPVGDARRGEVLADRWCATCHLQPGQAAATDVAPPFQRVAEKAASDPGFIRAFLNKPHAPMPPLNLNQAEIADLIAYLVEQAKR